MQENIGQFKAAKGIELLFADYELRFLREGHTWPVDEYGPCPPTPDWWTEKDEQQCHRQSEAITDMLKNGLPIQLWVEAGLQAAQSTIKGTPPCFIT